MLVEFTEIELKHIRALAKMRHEVGGYAVAPKGHSGSAQHIDEIGLLGEAAVAKVLGLPLTAYLFSKQDDGVDFRYEHLTISVKTSDHPKARYFIDGQNNHLCDIGVFCRVDGSKVHIVGYFTFWNWLVNREIKQFNGTSLNVLDQVHMKHFSDLMKGNQNAVQSK